MIEPLLFTRAVDADKEAKVESLYKDTFDGIRAEVWRSNEWSIKQPTLKALIEESKEKPAVLSFMNDNYSLLRGLDNEPPDNIVQALIPTNWGKENPSLLTSRGQFIKERQDNQGITSNDIRLFHTLGIEKNRQEYVRDRVLPAAEHAAGAYRFIDGTLGALGGIVTTLALSSERLGVLKGGKGALLGIGITALCAYAGGSLGATNGRKLIIGEYEETQRKVDQIKMKL